MNVAGIILAAGESRRLGRPKQLLDFRGKPLLQHAIDNVRASGLGEILLVLGANRDRIEPALDSTGVRLIVNPDFAKGQSTSLIAAVDALGSDIDGALFLLGDQPGITPHIIDAALNAFDGDPGTIVMTDWQGVPSHPVLIGRAYFDQVPTLTGDTGAKPILSNHRDRILLVPAGRPAPQDVDTEDDYQQLLATADE